MAVTPEQLAKGGSEHDHQAALFCWAALQQPQYPNLRLLFAIPNGGTRGDGTEKGRMISGARLKAEGVRAGVPDICLPVPLRNRAGTQYHGAFLEMKVGDNKPTEHQLAWLGYLQSQGYACAVCWGWEQARQFILAYLNGEI